MSARSHHNRVPTDPFGNDFNDVLKRGKVSFKISGEFMVCKYRETFTATRIPVWGGISEQYRFFKKDGRFWKEETVDDVIARHPNLSKA